MKLETGSLEPLTELIGIGIGRAAEVLNTMLGSPVRLSVPSLRVIAPGELAAALSPLGTENLSAVQMEFSGEFSGCAELVFKSVDAVRLVDRLIADLPLPGEDLDSIRAGTLCEIGNIVINAVLGTIANIVHSELEYSVPIYIYGHPDALLADLSYGSGVVILMTTRFQVESLEVDGDIVIFLSLSSFESLEGAMRRFADG